MNGMKALLMGLLTLVAPTTGPQPEPRGAGDRTLYFFFSPEASGQAELARRVVDYVLERKVEVQLRTVLIVVDFGAFGRIHEGSPFTQALKELGRFSSGSLDLAIYDEEGLALARSWKLKKLPALVLVAGGRAHVAMGSRVRPEDLEECR
jgi:hypothetical protein